MANHSEVDSTGMRPTVGMRTMVLPITFDYSGGRASREKSNKVASIVLSVIGVALSIAILLSKIVFYIKIPIALGFLAVFMFVIRFFFLKERRIRSEKIQDIDRDYKVEVSRFWGIYDIGDIFPYVCHFRSGKNGMFIQLNKDVVIGKFAEAEFNHYEAIGDAYNIAGGSNIQMCHLDYMDVVGSDERLEASFESLDRVSNPDLKDLLTDIYTYQQEMMYKRFSSFDVYLFLWSSRDDIAWGQIQRILACFLEANYRSYHVLNKKDVGELTKVIMYLNDNFSTESAMLNAFTTERERGIKAIRIDRADGTSEVLGKTAEEIKQEAREREEARQAKKNSKGKDTEKSDRNGKKGTKETKGTEKPANQSTKEPKGTTDTPKKPSRKTAEPVKQSDNEEFDIF